MEKVGSIPMNNRNTLTQPKRNKSTRKDGLALFNGNVSYCSSTSTADTHNIPYRVAKDNNAMMMIIMIIIS